VGNFNTILHYDGNVWTPMNGGNGFYIHQGIWGRSAGDVFIVGYLGVMLHYDGSGWSPLTNLTNHQLNGIWGDASGRVFTVGSEGIILQYSESVNLFLPLVVNH
jgi:hypothetical protein